jgi:hypothetical protein
MNWSKMDIFMSDQNLPFMVKILISKHNVAKTLIDNGSTLNLIMRHTFMEMGLHLSHLEPVRDTFHDIIPRVSTSPLGWIDLTVICGSRDNKHHETLTLEVDSFDMGYKCILGRHFYHWVSARVPLEEPF